MKIKKSNLALSVKFFGLNLQYQSSHESTDENFHDIENKIDFSQYISFALMILGVVSNIITITAVL